MDQCDLQIRRKGFEKEKINNLSKYKKSLSLCYSLIHKGEYMKGNHKTTNIMKNQKNSFAPLLQAGCSAILFISCLLPWLNLTSPQEALQGKFSLINMPLQTMNDAGVITNILPPSGSIFDYYRIPLYIILFSIFINVFIQPIKRIPFFTFYSCIIPTCFSYFFWTRVADCGNYLECTGIGLYLTNIFGTIAIIVALTEVGQNFQIHEKLFSFCKIWSIVSLVFPILLIIFSGHLRMQTADGNVIQKILLFLMAIISFIWIVGIIQIPFLIYAKIVSLLAEKRRRINESSNQHQIT